MQNLVVQYPMAYRILILDNEMDMGGKEKSLYQFISRVDRSRFHVAVCCLKSGGYFKEKLRALEVPFYDGLQHHRFDALAYRGLERVLRSERPGLIYTFSHPNTVIFSYMARLGGLVDRFVVSYHAMPESGRHVPAYLLPLLRRADALLAVAEVHKEFLVNVEGLPAEKIRVIHNGVDTSVYRPAEPGERERARRTMGAGDADMVLMAVASLKPLKRLDVLLRAAARLRREGVPVRVVIAGGGPDRDSLEALATGLGLHEHVVFAGVRDDVDELLRGADVFVLSSRTEAFPNVVLEAMATGLPVVTTDVGSVREMVEDGASALIVPAGDEAALAVAVRRFASDPRMRAAFGARGREIVERTFRIEDMCRKREALVEELLAASPRRVGS